MSWKATRNSLVCAGLLAASPAFAGWETRAPEAAFVFRGKPVDPRCVTSLTDPHMNVVSPVRLARCTKPGPIAQEGRKFTAVESRDGEWLRYDSYKVLASDGRRFVLLAVGAARDSHSSFLAVARLQGGMLLADTFQFRMRGESLSGPVLGPDWPTHGGDERCKLGLLNGRVEGQVLRWSETTTPYEILYFGGIQSLDAVKDLDMNDTACAAKRNMEYDLGRGETREASLTFEGPLKDRVGQTERFTYQHCFNGYFNGVLTDGRAELGPAAVQAFVDGFARACLAKAP